MRGFLYSLFVGLAVCLAAPTPVLANEDALSVSVSTRKLDLSKPADVARLHRKMNRAAAKACALSRGRIFHDSQTFAGCRSRALSYARVKADRAVAAAHGMGAGTGAGVQAVQ